MEKPPPLPDPEKRDLNSRQIYNVFTDTVGGLNLRKKDNDRQAIAIFVSVVIGAVIGAFWSQDHGKGAVVGGFAGLVAGLFLSGIALMIFRFIQHCRGKHD